jgi:hypothetical protein
MCILQRCQGLSCRSPRVNVPCIRHETHCHSRRSCAEYGRSFASKTVLKLVSQVSLASAVRPGNLPEGSPKSSEYRPTWGAKILMAVLFNEIGHLHSIPLLATASLPPFRKASKFAFQMLFWRGSRLIMPHLTEFGQYSLAALCMDKGDLSSMGSLTGDSVDHSGAFCFEFPDGIRGHFAPPNGLPACGTVGQISTSLDRILCLKSATGWTGESSLCRNGALFGSF